MEADTIAPRKTVTFTITKTPRAMRHRKTIRRLMQMQTNIQRALNRLSRRRKLHDNVPNRRGGRIWISRAKAAKLAVVEPGETFTLRITAQIVPDIRSVEKYLTAVEQR